MQQTHDMVHWESLGLASRALDKGVVTAMAATDGVEMHQAAPMDRQQLQDLIYAPSGLITML